MEKKIKYIHLSLKHCFFLCRFCCFVRGCLDSLIFLAHELICFKGDEEFKGGRLCWMNTVHQRWLTMELRSPELLNCLTLWRTLVLLLSERLQIMHRNYKT